MTIDSLKAAVSKGTAGQIEALVAGMPGIKGVTKQKYGHNHDGKLPVFITVRYELGVAPEGVINELYDRYSMSTNPPKCPTCK